MNPHYRIEALTHYPEWHNQPLRLTIPEIENPWLVLQDFFTIYDILNIRHDLDLLFENSLTAEDLDAKSSLYDIKNLQRLTEAAWLLHNQKKENEEQTTNENSEEEHKISTSKQPPFQKQLRLMDRVTQCPMQSLHEVFTSIGIKELKSIISNWLNSALTSNTEPYYTANERAGARAFCIQLKYLIEAGYIISRTNKIQEQRGIDVNNYNQLATDLFSKEGIEDLSEEEIMEPYTIVAQFFSRFSLHHSRAELWDLFATVVKSDDTTTNKTVLLINYQRLYTLIEALYILQANALKFDEC